MKSKARSVFAWMKPSRKALDKPRFDGLLEELEPRILFNADVAAPLAPDLLTSSDPAPQVLVLAPAPTAATQTASASSGAPASAQTAQTELVIVDGRVADAQTLVDQILAQNKGRQLEVHYLDNQHDGVTQITQILAGRQDISALHLITHGSDGQLVLGNGVLDDANLASHAAQLSSWQTALAPHADILLYGCDVAQTAQGQHFVDDFSLLTGANVAASTNATGSSNLGADWTLEYQDGAIHTSMLLNGEPVSQWDHLLANYVVTSTADTNTSGTLRYALNQINSTGSGSITFNISSGSAGTGSDSGAYVITLTSALPQITKAVSIDGSTQSGYVAGGLHTVVIDGADFGTIFDLASGASGSTIRGLVIRNSAGNGIYVESNANNVTVVGNYIGSFYADGSSAGTGKGNAAQGLYIFGGNALIGGTTVADRNVISGNGTAYDVWLDTGSNGTVVQGNYIGLNAAGTSAFANNTDYGIVIQGSANVTIGGTATGAGNVISGHNLQGIYESSTSSVTIQGNYIGTDAAGTADLGNGHWGIYLDDTGVATIGGTTAGAGNVISGNNNGGIYAVNAGSGYVTIQGNIIGLNATGTASLGNTGPGIYLNTGSASTIGGNSAAARNIISGNSTYGIDVESSPNPGHVIQGNYVGVASDGTTLIGNGSAGIYINASYVKVGGKNAGEGNTIAGNGGAGIAVSTGHDNLWYRNSIYSNTGLGIDLGNDGVTVNDYNDTDGGANYLNNYPVISSAVVNGSTTTITGSIDWYKHATADTIYIELFSSPTLDASGYGEGKTYLGAVSVTTDPTNGDATFSITVSGVNVGDYITAVGNIETSFIGASEFSPGLAATSIANAPKGKLIWTDNDQLDNWVSNWSGTAFSAPGMTGLNLGDDITMMTVAEAPTRDELIMIGAADVSGKIEAIVWNGSTWTAPLGLDIGTPSAAASQYSSFGLAYESQSGDAMLVWDNGTTGTAGLSYAVWNGTSWSAINTITAPSSGEPLQMKLVSNPVADGMVLVATTNTGNNNYAIVWNGSSWGNSQTLGTNTNKQYFEINAAYEAQTGNAMVVYDNSASDSSSLQYRTWNGSTWSSEGTISAAAGITAASDVYCTAIASDPTSNKIAVAVKDAANEVYVSVWSGSAWGTSRLITTSGIASPDNHATMAVAFESLSGDLLVAYGKAAGPYVYYQTCSSAGVWSAEQQGPSMGATDLTYSLKLYADPYSNTIMMADQDGGLDLNMVAWDGSAWGSVTTVDANTGEYYRENYAFAWNVYAPPSIGNLSGDTLAYTEDAAATVIDQGSVATVSDGDGIGWSGGNLTVSFTAGSTSSEDVLAIRNQGTGAGQIGISGSNVTYAGTTIGTYTGGSSGAALVITLNASATNAAVSALVNNVTYANTNTTTPSTSSRTVRFVATNARGTSSANVDTTVSVTAVNDAPTLTATGNNPSFTEGVGAGVQGAAVTVFSGCSISTIEPGQTIQSLTFTISGLLDGANESVVVDGTTITLGATSSGTTATNAMSYTATVSGGTATISLSKVAGVSTANMQTLVNGITYQNTNVDNPSSGNRVFTLTQVQDSGGTANGGVDTTSLSVGSTVAVSAINDSPTATITPVSYSATEQISLTLHGTGLSIADPDAGSSTVQVQLGVVSGTLNVAAGTTGVTVSNSGTSTVTLSGTITQINNLLAGNLSGTVTYIINSDTPPASDTLTLQVSDLGNTGTGGTLTASDTATINITAVNDAPTGSVTITGTATQGQTLTASNNIADADGMGTITYHWLRGGVDTGATGGTYLLSEADVGAVISARATYTDGYGTAEAVTSAATAAVANVNDAPTGSVTISGTPTQGQTLTASNNIADADGMGVITYHWLRNGVDTGSTGSTYVLAEADVGTAISAQAAYTDGHGTAETVTSAATAAVANVNDAPTGSVTITGTPTQGQTLTASNNIADADGMGVITYHWLRDGVDTGSTGSTYVLAEADVGTAISAQAAYTDGHGTAETVTSAATAAVANVNDAPTGSVTISGTPTQGQTLTASNNIADADGMGVITYHWLRDGVDTGSTGSTYVLAEADVGTAISAQAAYTDGHGTAETVTSAATAAVANVNDAPTGSVTITGTPTQGQTLTASNNIADADGMGVITYHWLRDGVDTGATGSTYVLAEADVGTAISAQAAYTDGHGTAETVTSAATAAVANVNDAPTGSVTITGTPTQGQTLTASNNIADADGMGVITYHWLRNGVNTGSTGSTYILAEADVGTAISAQAAYTDGHGTAETVTSAATAAVANVNDAPTGSVTISGTPTQGQTLTASNNIADADGMGTITYHWLRDGVDTGATGSTYVLAEADVGTAISAQAAYTDGHGTAETVTSAATAAVANVNDAPTGSVTISGTPTQGQTLTASNNIADADGMGVITYHWLRDGVDTGATGSTYVLAEADVGTAISAQAAYTDGHGTAETVTSAATAAVANVNDAPTGSVTITGTPTQGQTLTASNNIADADGMGVITYHWLRDGVDTGSTGSTYVLAEADVGTAISAQAAYTDGHGTAETVTSAATAAVANVNDAPTGSVTITGTPTQGQTLTASNNIADADGMGVITYHWLRDGVDTGATGSTYVLAEADVGTAISAQAAYADGHGTAETVTSAATAAVANVNDAPTGSVTISGTPTQGQTLTASNNIADADGMGVITYHWLRNGVDTGATGSTYVLAEADVGTAISAQAAYTDGHGTAETVTSAATAAVANVNDAPTGSVTISGTPTQGQTLTASNNIADADGMGVITYHWLRNGVDTGSTGSTYVLAEADVGTAISAQAAYTDGHGTAETVTSAATAAVANVNDAPTGSVTITGTPTQGQTLTASNNIADADGMGVITYHWLRNGVNTGSTGSTYILAEADVGTAISAQAAYTDGHGTAETVTSAATAAVANVNDAPTGSVTITGTPTQGQTLTASNNIADADGMGTITYHWLRDGVDTGATGSTYVLAEADVGTAISAQAAYTDGHGTAETVTSAATAAVANVNDAPTGSVTISGTPTQGQTLTASNNIADADGMGVITYHWLRDGVDTGATGSTYVLAEADVGTAISAQAAYTDGHGTAETVTSAATAAVANVNDAPTGSVTITGTATQGQTLTASNNIADADGMGVITYHWLRNGVDTGSTGSTYVLAEADVGTAISAQAAYTDGHGTTETVTSAATAAVANVNDAPTGSVTITGTPTQGQTLTASNNIADADGMGVITYHWLRDGVDTGATGSTYVLAEADVGTAISAQAAYTDGHGTAETVTSAATAAVANVNDAPTGSVTITGTPTQGQTLTASNNIADADGMGVITYHWLRDGVDTGSTGSTYVLAEADVGTAISAQAAYTDGHGTAETVTSSATAAVANVNDAPTGSVTISGTPTQGQTLTASNNIADADGMGVITYHWLRDGVDTGSTGSTYVLAEADVGTAISAQAAYTDGHGTAETVTSAATAAVANVNDAPTGSVTITGTPTQGQTLTASNNIADADGMGVITYHWLRDGVDTGSTGSTYVLAEADVGTAISAQAAYTDGHGTAEAVTSTATAAVANVNDAPTGSVTITGTPTQGQTLTATNNIADADGMGVITYHWLRDGVDTGSTGSTYVLAESDVGTAISAQAAYTDGHGTAETVTSAATAAVANVNDAPTGSVTITGTATQGQTLTASNNIADADGMGTITYHWLRNGVDTGSTGSTYVLAEADVGTAISAQAAYTDGHGTAEAVTSTATAAVANVNDAPTGSVTITGIPTQGQTLTAANNIADADGMGTITYHWLRNGVDTGATGATYLLAEADVGTAISAQAAYTDGHGTTETVTSAATVASAPAAIDFGPSTDTSNLNSPSVKQPDTSNQASVETNSSKASKETAPKPSQSPQPATPTPAKADGADLAPKDAAGAQLQRIQAGTWGPRAPMDSLGGSRQTLFSPTLGNYVPSMPSNPGNGATVIQLLDLIKPAVEHAQDINLLHTPLSSITHALPARSVADTSTSDQDQGQIPIKLTKVASYSTGLGLSIGTIWWTARISGLVTSALVSAPAWRSLDPLPVVTSPSDDPDHDEDGDNRLGDREVEHLFDGDKPIEQDMPVIQ